MTQLIGLIAFLLHAALVALIAPWLVGFTRTLRARLQGRRGPPVLQTWRDLIRLGRKETVLAENASVVTQGTPILVFAASAVAALLVPSFALGMSSAATSDLLLIAGLFALSHAAMALAAMDAGNWFGGLGVSREALFSFFAEPVLLLVFFTIFLVAGSTNLDHVVGFLRNGSEGLRVSLALGAAAMVTVALASMGRLPVGNPATHLEVTMLHESMTLEFSGRDLALIEAASQLRFFTWLALLAAIFVPFGIAPAGSMADWPLGLLSFGAKMLVLTAALTVFESGLARMRIFRVPELLGIALMLAILAVLFLFVSEGFT
jgi:formate hydrogenlyase subunit 4